MTNGFQKKHSCVWIETRLDGDISCVLSQKAEKERREKEDSGENKENKVAEQYLHYTNKLRQREHNSNWERFSLLSLFLQENNFLTPGPNINSRKSGRKVGEQVQVSFIIPLKALLQSWQHMQLCIKPTSLLKCNPWSNGCLLSKSSPHPNPWTGAWTTWAPTRTLPRKVEVVGRPSTLPLQTGETYILSNNGETLCSLVSRPGGPLTPSKNSTGVFGSLERGLDKMKNMLTPRWSLFWFVLYTVPKFSGNYAFNILELFLTFWSNQTKSRKSRGAGDGPVTVSGKGLCTELSLKQYVFKKI